MITLKEIPTPATRMNAAVSAFNNMYNMESVAGVMQAAAETGNSVMFQRRNRLADTAFGSFIASAIKEVIGQLSPPAVFHFDHGSGAPQILRALRFGAAGVMIDASTLPLGQNIAGTGEIVELCSECNVSRAGELGHVGAAADEKMSDYTDVAEAARFAEATGVSALAVMVETAHGIYNRAPVLDIQRIRDLSAAP